MMDISSKAFHYIRQFLRLVMLLTMKQSKIAIALPNVEFSRCIQTTGKFQQIKIEPMATRQTSCLMKMELQRTGYNIS